MRHEVSKPHPWNLTSGSTVRRDTIAWIPTVQNDKFISFSIRDARITNLIWSNIDVRDRMFPIVAEADDVVEHGLVQRAHYETHVKTGSLVCHRADEELGLRHSVDVRGYEFSFEIAIRADQLLMTPRLFKDRIRYRRKRG